VALVVQKYGGSSVADADGIKRVAQRIVATRKAGHSVVVAVSAMGDTTDDLLDLASQVSPVPPGRELDMLLTAGERISMALLAMAIANLGLEARSFTGSQAGVITDSTHGRARIIDVTPGRIQSALDAGAIPIVAGFQGVSQDSKDITTLGRGGTDTTAVALAAALRADVCEIYTDVDGVFTADPRIVPTARRLPRIAYEDMLEMAACGSKVLMVRCVEYARRYGIPIHVRSSFSSREGTWVTTAVTPEDSEETPMEQAIISGVAHDTNEAKITVVGVPDKVGEAARIFRAVADASINIDMIVQNISAAATRRTDISFTLPRADGQAAMTALNALRDEIGFDSLLYDDRIGKISLVGAGMRSNPGVSATFFGALAEAGVNIEMISTSEIRISVVVDENDVSVAVNATHDAFELGDGSEQAVVYGGTGR
jgi:aspartate kinase